MTYSLIESYADHAVSVGGFTLPAHCLVEDEDAMRLLITAERRFPAHVWSQASAGGAVAIVLPDGSWITAEGFLAHRAEHRADQSYEIPEVALKPGRPGMSYLDLNFEYDAIHQAATTAGTQGFVHLHAHSEFSPLDGLSKVSEMVGAAAAAGQGAIALTDHGYCSGHPILQSECDKAGIKPIFGIEAYFVENRLLRNPGKFEFEPEPDPPHPFPGLLAAEMSDEQRELLRIWGDERHAAREEWKVARQEAMDAHAALVKERQDYQHLILWAMDDRGLRNLWAMSTMGFLDGFYGKPRIDWDVLARYNEGVMASTACLRGPLAKPLKDREDLEMARANLGRLLGIFGDRLYAEIHTNQLEQQKAANEAIIALADEYGVPVIAAVDSHYPCADDHHTHKVWLASQTNKDLTDDGDLFAGHQDYHLMGADEVRFELGSTLQTDRPLPDRVIEEAIANTALVAERCTASLRSRVVMPVFTRPGTFATEAERVREDVERVTRLALGTAEDGYANFVRRCGGKKKPLTAYMERFEREMRLLVEKGYCGYFLMTWRQVSYAKSRGVLVGPGRGSGGGCLVAYLLGITEIDPVDADLLFERFLTEGRDEPPDFDVDYPSTFREEMQDFCTAEWGEDHTMRVGSHMRLKNKGVFQSLARIYKDEVDYKDFQEISKIIERAEAGTAGQGLKWDDLWAQHGDELEPYRERYPAIFELAERLVGRLKSYGKHAAGMVVAPDEVLTDSLPMRSSEKSNQPISQFDMDALTLLGYIKFDILTLRTLDTLQVCIDLIEKRHGRRINVYDWREGFNPETGEPYEYSDGTVWNPLCEGDTLGVFQVETKAGTRLTKQFKPRSVADLADIITLVRPGPVRSGLTDAYFRRREGFEEVTLPDPRLADVLAPTEGCIIYQEQVMQACQILGGYTLPEADAVRRILGKKKIELVEAAGAEFIPRCVERGMTQDAAEHLWEQLGEFAKYSFNKSHAWAYAVMGYWCAWFKVNYPIEFMTAVLSTVDKKRIPEFIAEARRMGYMVLPPDVNESGNDFTAGDLACRYGFEGVEGISDKTSDVIVAAQPYASLEDFRERSGVNKGILKTLARVGALDRFVGNRRALVEQLEWEDSEEGARCIHKDESVVSAHGLPCTFDWDGEPVEIGARGRPKKKKPPPKRCTRACRHYTAPPEPDWDSLPDYDPKEVREMESELLGIFLSSTPFDEVLEALKDDPPYTGYQMDNGPSGDYGTLGLVRRVKKHFDRHGREMAFLTLLCVDQEIDITVFKDDWSEWGGLLSVDTLLWCIVRKSNGRYNLNTNNFDPVIIPNH